MPIRRLILICMSMLLLVGCNIMSRQSAAISDVPVNTGAALAKVNAYRSSKGLPRLTLDPRLNDASRDMARLMARTDNSKPRTHSARGLSGRLTNSGVATYAGAENLGSGYTSFDHAFSGWKGSRDHDKNLLNKYVTRVGFARVKRPDGKWRNFWVMILARPVEDGRPTL
jgi:uncharacterized protein YkwD